MATPIITLARLQTFYEKLKTSMGGGQPTRTVIKQTAVSTGSQSVAIPEYSASSCFIDAYLNGFLLVPDDEYTISSSGTLTTVNTVNSGGVITIVVWRF